MVIIETPETFGYTFSSANGNQPLRCLYPSSSPLQEQIAREPTETIKACIGRFDHDRVELTCRVPDGEEFEITLPLELVPEDLRSFGQPVNLGLATIDGYRQPVITRREKDKMPPLEDEINAWLEAL
jgi:hypothetical protein